MSPLSFIIRLGLLFGAFKAADQVERPVLRALGFAYLLGVGILVTLGAISGSSWHTWIIGPGALAAAGYAFFSNR